MEIDDMPTELCTPENIIATTLDNGQLAQDVMKSLDRMGFVIVPKEPTREVHERRVLFSVIEVMGDGLSHMEVEWHPDIREAVDPDGKDTDQIIDLAERLLTADDDTPDGWLPDGSWKP